MKSRSVQAKGKRFEKAVAALASSLGFGLSRRESGSGNGQYKGDIAWTIPRTAELKNYHLDNFPKQLLKWIEQAEAQDLARAGWVLILRDPRSPESNLRGFAVVDMGMYFDFEMAMKEPKSKEPDRELKYLIERLVRSAHTCMKLAESRDDEWRYRDLKMTAKEVLKRFNHV